MFVALSVTTASVHGRLRKQRNGCQGRLQRYNVATHLDDPAIAMQFRMLSGGSHRRCDTLDKDDAAEADEGEREMNEIRNAAHLPFDEE